MESESGIYKDNSLLKAFFVIYIIVVVIAFTLIIPNEDHWYFGMLKSFIWPLYAVSKLG